MADSNGPNAAALDIPALCKERGWSRARLAGELRSVARQSGEVLPADQSLLRMIRMWGSGSRNPGPLYEQLLRRAFRLPDGVGQMESVDLLAERIDGVATAVDQELIVALDAHTDSLRLLDRKMGASRLLTQAETHVQSIEDLMAFAPYGSLRQSLAGGGAEAAALAGWQALDLGRPKHSWRLHQRARSLALESSDQAIVSHVTAQQAYALIDIGRPADALQQMQAVHADARGRVAGTVMAWLLAATAEAAAASGDAAETARLLDAAAAERDRSADAESVPFVFLSEGHLRRWRGACLAKVGSDEAVGELTAALAIMEPTFVRARASLHADLATAYDAAGQLDAARHHASEAEAIGRATNSARQRRRVQALLNAERKQVQ